MLLDYLLWKFDVIFSRDETLKSSSMREHQLRRRLNGTGTNLRVCSWLSSEYERNLSEFGCKARTGYNHSFVTLELNGRDLLLDGTYRQFFIEGREDAVKNNRRNSLPNYFLGTLDQLIVLYKENMDLLDENMIGWIKKEKQVEKVDENHIEEMVRRIYTPTGTISRDLYKSATLEKEVN